MGFQQNSNCVKPTRAVRRLISMSPCHGVGIGDVQRAVHCLMQLPCEAGINHGDDHKKVEQDCSRKVAGWAATNAGHVQQFVSKAFKCYFDPASF